MIYHLLTRCTGYRPILDAFKKFGSNAPGAKTRVAGLVADIEDLGLGGGSAICKRTGKVKDKIVREKKAYLLLRNQITPHRWLILSLNKYSQSLFEVYISWSPIFPFCNCQMDLLLIFIGTFALLHLTIQFHSVSFPSSSF